MDSELYSDNINSPAYQKSREYGVILKVMGTLTFDIVLDIKLDNNTKYLAANATGLIRKDINLVATEKIITINALFLILFFIV